MNKRKVRKKSDAWMQDTEILRYLALKPDTLKFSAKLSTPAAQPGSAIIGGEVEKSKRPKGQRFAFLLLGVLHRFKSDEISELRREEKCLIPIRDGETFQSAADRVAAGWYPCPSHKTQDGLAYQFPGGPGRAVVEIRQVQEVSAQELRVLEKFITVMQ